MVRQALSRSPAIIEFRRRLEQERVLEVAGLAGSANAFLIDDIWRNRKQTALVIAPFAALAENLHADLQDVCGEDVVHLFPEWGAYPYDWIAPPQENVAARLETLWNLNTAVPCVVVTTPEALRQPTITQAQLKSVCFDLRPGLEFDLTTLVEWLASLGYERMSICEEVGTFAVRGGILDVFPFTSANPVRCEFFGDMIDSLRLFSVISQRSIEKVESIAIIPRREILLTPDEMERRVDALDPVVADRLRDKLLSGFDYPGLEWVASLLGVERASLLDHLGPEASVYICDPDAVDSRFEHFDDETQALHEQHRLTFPEAPAPERIYDLSATVLQRLAALPAVRERVLGHTHDGVSFDFRDHPSLNGQISALRGLLDDWLAAHKTVFLLSDTELQSERLEELLNEYSGRVTFAVSSLMRGFLAPDCDLVVLTDHQIFERQVIRRRRRKFKEGQAISSYNALELGDYIVHIDYGIGRYRGLRDISIDGRKRECLLIAYADDDKLYVPIEQFARVQKYVGKEGAPQLTKLGSKGWERVKARTKKAIADMAEELIRLYAARKARPGLAFPADDDLMRQLEASFPFEETADQLTAIAAVKSDMMLAAPMDRLICGDVGFGKTEVAIRAALKAIAGGKQVAVLVPTTILARQHLDTFRRRLGSFPIRIEMLSRFRSKAEQKQIIADLDAQKVDIVIGTHRLLQKDMHIPNLGLIVVDEEQRFGVRHKERLKFLRQQADCLTMTATPIPRTLQMSLLGARDMSLINTSPKDRQPIATEIAEFDPKIIYEAINYEVSRQGQVYFVHNRVETIESMHRYLSKLLKHIRIAVAHGQMDEHELEEVMIGFLNKDYDVLLSSAIIESGIDIPSVNTIIINRADRFGLAQLYQLRGRVGRSQHRAYAYLLIPPVKQLTDTARKRLKAIEQHTDLGSGFHLAMKDLEIRGAGNMLGAQQHGFIEEVGFDLYCRLLEEAVAEIKGEPTQLDFEVKLEVDADSYIPETYIEDSRQRVDIYRKIADARSADDLEIVGQELIDRFGKYGAETENLLDLMAINITARRQRIARVRLVGSTFSMSWAAESFPSKAQIERLRTAVPAGIEFDSSDGFVAKITFPRNEPAPLKSARKLLLTLELSL